MVFRILTKIDRKTFEIKRGEGREVRELVDRVVVKDPPLNVIGGSAGTAYLRHAEHHAARSNRHGCRGATDAGGPR